MKDHSKEKLRIRKYKDSMFKNPVHVNTLDWDNEWRKDIVKERNRYRTRLAKKHKNKTKSMTI